MAFTKMFASDLIFDAATRSMFSMNESFERDYFYDVIFRMMFHDVIFETLSEAGILPSLEFMGGTCLFRCYGMERLSEDLDFQLVNPANAESRIFNEIGHHLQNEIVTKAQMYGIGKDRIKTRGPDEERMAYNPEKEPRVRKWKYSIDMGSMRRCVVKIEISSSVGMHPKLFMMSRLPESPVDSAIFPVNIRPLEDIWTDKAAAILQRSQIKFRDFHDFKAIADKLPGTIFDDGKAVEAWNNMEGRMPDLNVLSRKTLERIQQILALKDRDDFKDMYWEKIERFLRQQPLDAMKSNDYQNVVLDSVCSMAKDMRSFVLKNHSHGLENGGSNPEKGDCVNGSKKKRVFQRMR